MNREPDIRAARRARPPQDQAESNQVSPIAGAVRYLARIVILGTLLGVLLFAFYVLIAIVRAG